MLPWTDGSAVVTSKEKRATLTYAQTSGRGIGLQVKASGPLDEDTHIAALSDDNHLVGGFSGALEIGWDSRADRIAALDAITRRVTTSVEKLSSISEGALNGDRDRLVRAQNLGPNDATATGLYLWFCRKQGIAEINCNQDNLAFLAGACAAYFETTCPTADSFTRAAARYWTKNCSRHTADEDLIACVAADVLAERATKQVAIDEVKQDLDPDTAARIWKIYEFLAPDEAKKCNTEKIQCIVDNAGKVADTIRDFVRTGPLERRDLLMFGLQENRFDHALAVRTSVSYDRSKVYQDDVAAKATTAVAYDFQIGADYTIYTPVSGLVGNARAGYERTQDTGAKPFERCIQDPSGDMTITGKACDPKALFRKGGAPGADDSVFIRAAIDYQYAGPQSNDKLVPGVELRGGIEGIGAQRMLEGRLTLFGTPVRGTTAARVGVALDLRYAIDPFKPGDDTPRLVATPLVFLAATFTDLMGQ